MHLESSLMNYDAFRQRLLERLALGEIDDAAYDQRIAELDRLEQAAMKRSSGNTDWNDVPETFPTVAGPGFQLGKYILRDTSGSGGMGIIWQAIDTEAEVTDPDDAIVAIKVLPKDMQRLSGEMDRFKKTFQIVRKLHHDHICPLYELSHFSHADIGWFQVMRFLKGRTLAEYREAYVEQHDRFPVSEVVRLLEPIARALDFAHGQRVVHRDLKPENIFIEGHDLHVEKVWLIDFGVAAEIRSTMTRLNTNSAETSGSPAYLSPELLKAGFPDAKSDQYALGVVVFELLAGHPPFNAADFTVFRHAALSDAVPELEDESAAVNAVLQQVLAKDKQQRFASCVAFIQALTNCDSERQEKTFTGEPEGVSPRASAIVRGLTPSGSPRDIGARPTSPPPLLSAPFSEAHILAARRQWVEYLKQPEAVSLPSGSRCLLIPPGEFTMGSQLSPDDLVKHFEAKGYHKADVSFFKRELPAHRVKLTQSFWMAEHPVTMAEFKAFVSLTGYKTDAEKDGGGRAYDVPSKQWQNKSDCLWWSPGFSQSEQHPVVVVSHNDAVAYCAWLSQQSGHSCRLAREAEWEYAARAGTTGLYFHGDDPEGLTRYANVADAALKQQIADWPWVIIRGNDGHAFTSPVGSFEANPFGLRDMLGNCLEWCNDWFAEDYYAQSPTEDPQGPAVGSSRVLRGGSWNTGPHNVRCSYRHHVDPAGRNYNIGFRLVVEL